MKKIEMVNVAKIAGVAIGLAATLLSNYTQQKEMRETIKKEVNEALKVHQ